jgi:choline kinase
MVGYYKVLITTSGTGSRLGSITKYTNKSLVPLGDRAALSHIVEKYPDNVELVVTIGYFANHVRDYLTISYPNKNITFVEIDKYEGQGSSLVYSMLQARDHLQCPFIFHACDTIVNDQIPPPNHNWLGGSCRGDSSDYRTIKALGSNVIDLGEKGEATYDYVYIGLAGIKDYEEFWRIADEIYFQQSDNNQLSDVHVTQELMRDNEFKLIIFNEWYDIGNIKTLNLAREHLGGISGILEKEDESIHIFDEFVVKFFHDKNIIDKRIERSKLLRGLVPDIISRRDNFYKYRMVQGETLSKMVNEQIFSNLLWWAKENLWKYKGESGDFYEVSKNFYYKKTRERLQLFTQKTGRRDKTEQINDCEVPSVEKLLGSIPDTLLCTNKMYGYHGDFILENIIYNHGSFTLIDWRQDFGGDLENGDIYYDFAKMNHNLILDHNLISRKFFDISMSSSNIKCDILRKNLFCKCQGILLDFIKKNGFREDKVNVLTPLIWINMSPLHNYPLNIFLYYFGRYSLWRELTYQNYI